MALKIPFHIPYLSGDEQTHVQKVISTNKVGTGGYYTRSAEEFLQGYTASKKVLLTSSCTHALEISAMLINIQKGDEVIMPSYNFVSAANAFVLRGAKIVFVDIDPITMNVDPDCILAAITNKTKAVLIMHYGGVACEMDRIMPIIKNHQLFLIEDAAHCIGSLYKGKHLGTFGHLGTLSFHYTKNIHCGEGGALMINDKSLIDRAEIIREKGTNRKQFLEGKIDKYTWVDIGSSYLMNELTASFLWGQLENIDKIKKARVENWNLYYELIVKSQITINENIGNAHHFFIKCNDNNSRAKIIKQLQINGIGSAFHYIPLHSVKFALNKTSFSELDKFTTSESQKLLRLPLYPTLLNSEIELIINILLNKFENNN